MFDVNKEIYNLMEEVGIFTEARTGHQKKIYQKINRRKREERQKNERDFKSKLNFSHTGYGKDGSEYGTIKIGDKVGDIQLYHHSSNVKHNPSYNSHDSKILMHKADVNVPDSYTYGGHELSHANDDGKTQKEKDVLNNLRRTNEYYRNIANDTTKPNQIRDMANKAANASASDANNKYHEYEGRRLEKIKRRDNTSDTVKRVQNKVQLLTKRDGKSPVVHGHDDKGSEIRADELVLKSFKGSHNKMIKNLNRLSDASVRKLGEEYINPREVDMSTNKLTYSGNIYKNNLLRIAHSLSYNALQITKLQEKLKTTPVNTLEYFTIQRKISLTRDTMNNLKAEQRNLKEKYKTFRADRRKGFVTKKDELNRTAKKYHKINSNRVNIIKDNMR